MNKELKKEILIVVGIILVNILAVIGYWAYKAQNKALNEFSVNMYNLGRQDQLSIDRYEFNSYRQQVSQFIEQNYVQKTTTTTGRMGENDDRK